jgi:hypothetical protein
MGHKGKNRSLVWSCDISIDWEFYMEQEKTYSSKRQKQPSELKNGIWGPKSVWSCDISIDWEFYMEQENHTFGGQKGKNSLQSSKTELGPQKFKYICSR